MTLFFNIENLEKEALCDSKKFLILLERFYYKKLPTYRISKPKLPLAGTSYLLNPEPLFKIKKLIDINYIIQYIKLAGRRDYNMYKYYKYKALSLSYFPDIILENIKHNPLLKITSTDIYFLYEEKINKER